MATEIAPEIIQRIASLTVLPNSTAKSCLPWIMSWVCSHWRCAVLGHRQLWATVPSNHILNRWGTEDGYDEERVEDVRFAEMVDILLQRSGDCPLTIHFHRTRNSKAFDLLLQHRHRWESADLYSDAFQLQSVFASVAAQFRCLHSLKATVRSGGPASAQIWRYSSQDSSEPDSDSDIQSGDKQPHILDISNLPALRSFTIIPQHFISQPPYMILPTGSITSYKGELHRRNIAQLAPQLEDFHLYCHASDRPLTAIFTLPKVTRLYIVDDCFFSEDDTLLNFIKLPSLHMLAVQFRATDAPVLGGMLRRSGICDTLTTLHLYSSKSLWYETRAEKLINESELRGLFAIIPRLAELKTSFTDVAGLLCPCPEGNDTPDEPCLLPYLQHLTIIVRQGTEAPFSCIHQIAVLRSEEMNMKGLVCRLEDVEVVVADTFLSPFIERPWAAQTPAQDIARGALEPGWRTPYSGDDERQSKSRLEELEAYCTGRLLRSTIESKLSRHPNLFADWLARFKDNMVTPGYVSITHEIYISGIHAVMEDTAAFFKTSGYENHSRVVQDILHYWRPQLSKLVDSIRWFNKGKNTIVFFPKDDPRREIYKEFLLTTIPRVDELETLDERFYPFSQRIFNANC